MRTIPCIALDWVVLSVFAPGHRRVRVSARRDRGRVGHQQLGERAAGEDARLARAIEDDFLVIKGIIIIIINLVGARVCLLGDALERLHVKYCPTADAL